MIESEENKKHENKKQILPSEVEHKIAGLVKDKNVQEKVINLFSQSIKTTQKFSAPIPHPEMLKEYNEVLPGLAERIVKMAENQSEHRIESEKKVINSQLKQSEDGQKFALYLGGLFLVGAVILGLTGHDSVAITLGGVDIVGLVSVFIIGKKRQKSDLEEKSG